MFVKVLNVGFSLGGGKDVYEGDVFDMKASEALPKIQKGMLREATPEEVAEHVAAARQAAKDAAAAGDDDDAAGGKATKKK